MKDILKNIKIDVWWKLCIVLGLFLFIIPFIYPIDLVNPKRIIGIGIGMFIIGISCFIANRHIQIPARGGFWITEEVIHTPITRLFFIIGIIIATIFIMLLIVELVECESINKICRLI